MATALTNPAVPELVWFIPCVVLVAVFAYRLFIVAPYDIYREEHSRTATQMSALSLRQLQRPRIALSARLVQWRDKHWITMFCIQNAGDALAVEVTTSFLFPDTRMRITFSFPSITHTEPPRDFLPDMVDSDGKDWDDYMAPLDTFATEAHKCALASRSVDVAERLRNAASVGDDVAVFAEAVDPKFVQVREDIQQELRKPDYVEFDVTYLDFSRRTRYRTTHALTYNEGRDMRSRFDPPKIRIDLIADREPEQIAS